MSEFIPPRQETVKSWICSNIRENYQVQALQIATKKGYREKELLPENSWLCLEAHLLSKLGIKELSQWIANSYPPVEFTRVIEHITQTHNISPQLELGEKEWRELQKNYEKTTCK